MMHALRLPLIALATLVAARSIGAQQQQARPVDGPSKRDVLVATLDSLARNYITETPATGLTIAVVHRGDTLLLGGYGERDRERHLAADASTVYRVGSITKQFTAAAIMRLVERGAVRLEDPVSKYLPQYPQWKGVTIRHLLNHTSGIHSYTASAEWRKHAAEDLSTAAIVGFVEKDTLDFPTGTRWRYNNTGYMLLGMVLEKVTKQPYATLMERDFFRPLGMRTATYCPSASSDALHAVGYAYDDESFRLAEPLSMTHPYSAGALCMSVPDYLRWQSALTRGKIVSARSLALMTGPESLSTGKSTSYGMGLAPGKVGTHATVQHGGSINGFSTQQYWFPAESLSIVAFVNTNGADPDWLVNNVAAAVFGMPTTKKKLETVPLAAADRAKYEGAYDIMLPDGNVLQLRIFAEGDQLLGQANGQGKMPIRYLGDDTFGVDFDPKLRMKFRVEGGRVLSGSLLQNGETMAMKRKP
jgi:CubicO group peptidase (beta-lactamase class C family)